MNSDPSSRSSLRTTSSGMWNRWKRPGPAARLRGRSAGSSGLRRARELRPPEADRGLGQPRRHVTELKSQVRWLFALVEREQVVQQDPERPPVGDDVVQHEAEHVVVVAELEQGHPERRLGQVEGGVGPLADQLHVAGVLDRNRSGGMHRRPARSWNPSWNEVRRPRARATTASSATPGVDHGRAARVIAATGTCCTTRPPDRSRCRNHNRCWAGVSGGFAPWGRSRDGLR